MALYAFLTVAGSVKMHTRNVASRCGQNPVPAVKPGGLEAPTRVLSTITGRSRLPPLGMTHGNARTACHADAARCFSRAAVLSPWRYRAFPSHRAPHAQELPLTFIKGRSAGDRFSELRFGGGCLDFSFIPEDVFAG